MIDLILHFLPVLAALSALPIAAAIVLLRPGWFARRARFYAEFETAWKRLARKPYLAVSLLCLIQLAGVGVRWAYRGVPVPYVHDEFSYLLMGETFAMGRLTNPTHPMWVHFESAHIFHVPSYTSFYPPGRGIAIAAGILLGHPWIGIVLGTMLMIALVYWAARQWLAPGWALLAGVFGLCLVLGTYWSYSYWGGALYAAAGALVTGAAGALRLRASSRRLTILAAGAVLCAITRPYEGLVLVLLTAAGLLWRIARGDADKPGAYVRASVPALILLAVSACGVLAYNFRVTGSATTMPYEAGASQYVARRKFVFQSDPPPPVYRHKELRDIYVNLKREGMPTHWRVYGSLKTLAKHYLSLPLTPLFLFAILLAATGRAKRLRPVVLTSMGGIAAVLAIPWINPHYFAPFAAAVIISSVLGLRFLSAASYRGVRPFWFVVAAGIVILGARTGAGLASGAIAPLEPEREWGIERDRIERSLRSLPGEDLVIVRYSADHNWLEEWVYNDPDIDASPVIWAREMDGTRNAELLQYFYGRKAWLLEPDAKPAALKPYPRDAVNGSAR